MRYHLRCHQGGEEYDSDYDSQICKKCDCFLEVLYDHKVPRINGSGKFWNYRQALPDCDYPDYELGSTRLMASHDLQNVSLKLETDNPTRSFKDRGSIIEISKAVEYGYKEVSVASTGNMAYSIAHYAKLAGLRVKAFLSNAANKDKVNFIMAEHDAKVVHVKGDFTTAQSLAIKYANKANAFLVGDYCYRKEGQKTMAYEIIDQLPNTDRIMVPVGNATLISGIAKGLTEMKAAGKISRLPMLVGVQSKGCAPLVTAFKSDNWVKYVVPKTAADAIAVGYPTFGNQAVEDLKASKGDAVAVSDADLKSEQERFRKEYGLVAELAGVAGIAAVRNSNYGKNERIVSIVSGGNV